MTIPWTPQKLRLVCTFSTLGVIVMVLLAAVWTQDMSFINLMVVVSVPPLVVLGWYYAHYDYRAHKDRTSRLAAYPHRSSVGTVTSAAEQSAVRLNIPHVETYVVVGSQVNIAAYVSGTNRKNKTLHVVVTSAASKYLTTDELVALILNQVPSAMLHESTHSASMSLWVGCSVAGVASLLFVIPGLGLLCFGFFALAIVLGLYAMSLRKRASLSAPVSSVMLSYDPKNTLSAYQKLSDNVVNITPYVATGCWVLSPPSLSSVNNVGVSDTQTVIRDRIAYLCASLSRPIPETETVVPDRSRFFADRIEFVKTVHESRRLTNTLDNTPMIQTGLKVFSALSSMQNKNSVGHPDFSILEGIDMLTEHIETELRDDPGVRVNGDLWEALEPEDQIRAAFLTQPLGWIVYAKESRHSSVWVPVNEREWEQWQYLGERDWTDLTANGGSFTGIRTTTPEDMQSVALWLPMAGPHNSSGWFIDPYQVTPRSFRYFTSGAWTHLTSPA